MALLETPEANTGEKAPDFNLKNIDGTLLSLDDVKGEKGTVVAFICNHCPYVKAIIDRLVATAKLLEESGIKTVAIMPNDTENYPQDSFENMKKFAEENNFSFPYLIDETQGIARAYGAVCTPDIFGLNADNEIQYRGRVDSAGKDPVTDDTIPELVLAMEDIAKTGSFDGQQYPSMGCSIKWRNDKAA